MASKWLATVAALKRVVEETERELEDARRMLREAESKCEDAQQFALPAPIAVAPASPPSTTAAAAPARRASGAMRQGPDPKVTTIEKTLRAIGQVSHFDIIKQQALEVFGVTLVKANCVGMLNAKAADGDTFTKEGPNTYGLIEWRKRDAPALPQSPAVQAPAVVTPTPIAAPTSPAPAVFIPPNPPLGT